MGYEASVHLPHGWPLRSCSFPGPFPTPAQAQPPVLTSPAQSATTGRSTGTAREPQGEGNLPPGPSTWTLADGAPASPLATRCDAQARAV